METLIKKLEIIDFKYKSEEKALFNIFSLLRNAYDEVHLHSRFIFELLNPKGSHQKSDIFLRLFLDVVGIDDYSLANVRVDKEKENIDILILNRERAIILENKIGAVDQLFQIERYYNLLKARNYHEKNISTIYLTVSGSQPTEQSIGKLKGNLVFENKLILISYNNHIRDWLKLCVKECASFPALRETLFQYQNIVDIITGNSNMEKEKSDVLNLLRSDNNAVNAYKILQNWNHLRWHTEFDFWLELEEIIFKNNFEILPLKKYSEELVSNVVHGKKNRMPWFGLMFKLSKWEDFDLCICIERSENILYYGIIMVKENTCHPTSTFLALKDQLQDLCEWKATDGWLGGNLSKSPINFEAFSNEDTIRLANPQHRSTAINNLWNEIKDFVSVVKNRMPDLHNGVTLSDANLLS